MVPKLTHAHISPDAFQKMEVKYATQIFSQTLSSALYTYSVAIKSGKHVIETAEFLDKIDTLFDMFNSSKFKEYKIMKRPFSGTKSK